MKRKFGGNERVKRSLLQTLRRDFEILTMKNDDNIDDYFRRVMTISNQIISNGEDMPTLKIVEKILRTLTEKFTYVVVSIEESKDTRDMTIDELQSSLFIHEKKFKKNIYEEEDQDLNVGAKGQGSYRGSYKGRGRSRGCPFNKATIECYNSHKLGNFQYECPNGNNGVHFAEIHEKDEVLLMAYIKLQGTRRGDVCFVDSGYSNHMCGERIMFSSLDTAFTHNVKLGNNHKLIVGKNGVVKITLKGVSYMVNDMS